MTSASPRKAVVVGLSGCSSSGKTTIARLLRDIFPNTVVLHEDDFYKPETELPTKNGLLDWDCAEALSIPDITSTLTYFHQTGTFPPTLDSKEDQNSIGPCPIPSSTITDLKQKVHAWTAPSQPGHALLTHPPTKICILDGFLLYTPPLAQVQPLLDIKLFLRTTHALAKARREARAGYVTLEGFWEDPPGYVDVVVWPNYVAAHRFLFEGGDVEGVVDEAVVGEWGLDVVGGEEDLGEVLRWAVGVLMERLPGIVGV